MSEFCQVFPADNGAPDAPGLCFLCRKESERGKVFDRQRGGYVYAADRGEDGR